MQKKSTNKRRLASSPALFFPDELTRALVGVERISGNIFYLTGGTVRDWLLGREPADLDITVKSGAAACCRELIDQLGEGAFVPLGTGEEDAARVVWRSKGVDFSSFRKGAKTIEEDLARRDFTINAMALPFSASQAGGGGKILDPLGGRDDIEKRVLRHCQGAFTADPLRMLRGYRLSAELGFGCDEKCLTEISKLASLIKRSSAERIQYELDRIMASGRAADIFKSMSLTGLLWYILPELKEGLGMDQPGYHHEDVFHHNLLTLQCIDRVIREPADYFPESPQPIFSYLQDAKKRNCLRWAAFFHDLGKPATYSSGTIKPGRITFYNHDRAGREIFEEIAARLRWSRVSTEVVAKLIELHMHPFHLCNVKRESPVSRKACLRICKRADDDLPGLFVLAMADSLAGQGELKPVNMEGELAQLYAEVQLANEKLIQPVLKGKRLVSGHDLIEMFNLTPGPFFSSVFRDLEVAMVEERVRTRAEALIWVKEYLEKR